MKLSMPMNTNCHSCLLFDLTVPATAVGIANLDDGIVGLAGTVSSLIGVWSQWRKTAA